MSKRLIIYDIANFDEKRFLKEHSDDLLFSASPMVKHCIGCFGCWVKTPGKCVIKDRCGVMPSYMAQSEEIMIISPMLYGGYSQNIKAIMDRSIGYVLPFFQIVNGEMNHRMRYQNPFRLRVHFYGSCNQAERETAKQLVGANAVNLGAGSHSVDFYASFEPILEEIK